MLTGDRCYEELHLIFEKSSFPEESIKLKNETARHETSVP